MLNKKLFILSIFLVVAIAHFSSALGPAPVNLGSAGNYVILSKTGVTNVPSSAITGNVGTSPITGAANGLTCTEVTGSIYSVDAAGPAPCSIEDPSRLTTAVSDMETAYTDAAGRSATDFLNMGAGDVSGLTLAPGIYTWGTGVLAASDFTIAGGANDVWIFQVAEDLTVSNGVIVHLSGGAQPKNIFWQVAGQATLGTTSQFKGIILSQTAINAQTGASVNGRLLAQTEVTLQSNAITQPSSSGSSSTPDESEETPEEADEEVEETNEETDTTEEAVWACNAWSTCTSSRTQTRSCTSDGERPRTESRACTYIAPVVEGVVVEEETIPTPTIVAEQEQQIEGTADTAPKSRKWLIIAAITVVAAGIGAFAFFSRKN